MMENSQDRFRGCMLGLAIGDALGYPAEFRTRQQILDTFGSEGLTDFVSVDDDRWPRTPVIAGAPQHAGTVSDDTQMTMALARGFLDVRSQDVEVAMPAVGRRFVEWSVSPENNRAPGGTCMTGCRRLENGVPWREANVAQSKGCGSAMRVAPVGLLFHDDFEEAAEVARASSLLTHGHPAGVEGAAAAALLVALAFHDTPPDEMWEEVMRVCGGRSTDFDRCLERVPEMLDDPPGVALSAAGLGEGWVAEEAVASALYCYWNAPGDFARAVLLAANTDGDSDSIAAIAGSIAGARHGMQALDERWRARVEYAAQLEQLADDLLLLHDEWNAVSNAS
jgi:ADP-ribosylglycohydrolase